MVLKVSKRGQVPPFMVMDVMKEAARLEAAGSAIVHLEVGQPATGIPKKAAAAVSCLLEQKPLGYTVANGIPELREKISAHYHAKYGAKVSPERIFVTTGSSAAFQLAFLSAFEPGDRVALAAPGYPAYRHILAALGIEPVLIEAGADSRYQPTTGHLSDLKTPVDGLILASPSNPTGTIIEPEELMRLIAYCDENGIRLISDEIYHGISFGIEEQTAAGRLDSAFVVNSFSKYFSMTGWRLGWLVVPQDLARSIECLSQNFFISPPTISQWAGVYVFDCFEELEANVERYRANRSVLLKGLEESGFRNLAPADGAFYVYADVSDWTEDSVAFCRDMLNESGVATTPGVDFDPINGNKFVRFCFAGSTGEMEDAVKRLKLWRR